MPSLPPAAARELRAWLDDLEVLLDRGRALLADAEPPARRAAPEAVGMVNLAAAMQRTGKSREALRRLCLTMPGIGRKEDDGGWFIDTAQVMRLERRRRRRAPPKRG